MTIAVDIGNSNIVIGYHCDDTWQYSFRLETRADYPAEKYILLLKEQFASHKTALIPGIRVVISSVVPRLRPVFIAVMQELTGGIPVLVAPDLYSRLPVNVTNPQEIGTDLVANAVAAWDLYRENVIIVDFGTALTLTCVSEHAVIKGIAIAPGLKTAVKSLFSDTAQLPEVSLTTPVSVLGTNTIDAIRAGIVFGYQGMVETLVKRAKEEMASNARVIFTGGMAKVIMPLTSVYDHYHPHLTLDGLRIIGRYSEIAPFTPK
ncbi:MAG: type III pantothenate kinase [Bacteroidales bacterium]